MFNLLSAARPMMVCVVLGLGMLAAGAVTSHAQAPQAPAADNGIVGIAIGRDADKVGAPARLVVERVLPGGPGQAAGVQRGDEITAINGGPVAGMKLDDIVHLVRGKVGTTVTLTLNRNGEMHTVSVKREQAPPHGEGRPPQPAQ